MGFYQEHEIQPRRLTDAARVGPVFWSQWFDWRGALMIVQPERLIGWHRKGFKRLWRRKSKMGRWRLPEKIRRLIARMVKENPSWGQERVAAELSLKLGIMPEHVHMCIAIPPKHPVASVIGFLKGKSAIAIARMSGKERNFSGEHFWARGYAVSTVGFEREQVRKYIREQELADGTPGQF